MNLSFVDVDSWPWTDHLQCIPEYSVILLFDTIPNPKCIDPTAWCYGHLRSSLHSGLFVCLFCS